MDVPFEYFFQIKVLNQYQNAPKNANITSYIKKKKTLCKTLNWGNWNWGFIKLGVRWAERDNKQEYLKKKSCVGTYSMPGPDFKNVSTCL